MFKIKRLDMQLQKRLGAGSNEHCRGRHTVLATAKLTSFSLMPLSENETFHARKRIILKTKAQIRKFNTASEKPKARKRNTECTQTKARKRNTG